MTPPVHSAIDRHARTVTITTTFARPSAAVWALWSDPDELARWWGPPGLPMTVDHHDLRPGGRVEVAVQAGGSVVRGRWSIVDVDPPRSLRFTFASDGLDPTDIDVLIEPTSETSTTMTLTARFRSDEDLRHAVDIGFDAGLARSCGAAHAVV